MMKGSPIFLSLILFSIIQCLNSVDSLPEEPHDSMRVELIHRHDPRHNARPKTQLESMKELLHNDNIRLNMISHKLGLSQKPRRQAWETSTSNNDAILPMYSGINSLYYATFKVGTPSQTIEVMVDTGSHLTWVDCRYQSKDHKRSACADAKCRSHKGVFDADFSSSFKPILCHSPMCADLKHFSRHRNDYCPTPKTLCRYEIWYGGGAHIVKGILVNETVTVPLTNGGEAKLDNVVIGCQNSVESSGTEGLQGLMGLGYSKNTFASKVIERFGGKFSYCLADYRNQKNISNHLTFGANYDKKSLLSNMSYTKLEVNWFGTAHYGVNVVGISIGGVMLNIPSEKWEPKNGGGVIIDSGTTQSILTDAAYNAVTTTLMKYLSNLKRETFEGIPLDYCFNSTGFKESMVPRLAFHFADGARFEPHVKGYIVDIDEKQGVKCIGFENQGWSGFSVIGNLLQQNYLWEFDIAGQKLGFAPSTCA